MQRDIIVKARGLGASSDLTLLAPLRRGLVDSHESVTFKSRVQRVLDTLHGMRRSSHEFSMARWISDSIERVDAIQSVRVAVLEPHDSVMLAVTFEGSWESYIRVLWARVGTLLDLIFCNTVDYVTARDHSFEEWLCWARRVQVETGFFYGPPDTTARDALFQRRVERMRQRGAGDEVNELRAVLPRATVAAGRLSNPVPAFADEPVFQLPALAPLRYDQVRTGLMGVAALYRLVDLYPPERDDGDVLRYAALDLLLEFVQLRDNLAITNELTEARDTRFARQVDWLFPPGSDPVQWHRSIPAAPEDQPPLVGRDRHDIQGGILHAYEGTSHGAVLLLSFDDPGAVVALLDWLDQASWRLTHDDDSHQIANAPGGAFRNLAWTLAGLRLAGLDEDTLARFPEDYRQGMAHRAGHLGDVYNNHPRRWRLPRPFDSLTLDDKAQGAIDLGTVHAVLQLRCGPPAAGAGEQPLRDPAHPLHAQLKAFVGAPQLRRVRVLAVQPLLRRFRTEADGTQNIVDHFGYADGSGQPEIDSDRAVRNRIHVGEIVVGHDNAADFGWSASERATSTEPKEQMRAWLRNGSFLVLRKYREFPHRLEQVVQRAAEEIAGADAVADRELAYAKLMGRWRSGHALMPGGADINNFTYDDDPQGRICPLHAHVRRAHPRPPAVDEGMRLPRLMRRGMSYGPAYAPGNEDGQDRGLVFMAYNASIGEQFEVVQRWLTGGNSTGNSSGTTCPIVGVPDNGLVRHFRFEVTDLQGEGRVVRVALEDPQASLLDQPPALTQLEWGVYLFTPSFSALRRLRAVACGAAARAPAQPVAWELERGQSILDELFRLQATADAETAIAGWKAALQDTQAIDRLDAAALWAAIRQRHGGLLSTSFGHIVANRRWIHEVLLDRQNRYSLRGQLTRMEHCFGPSYLGMDDGPAYRSQSTAVNEAISGLKPEEAYKVAFEAAAGKLDRIKALAMDQAARATDARYEISFEAREIVDEALAALCETWYGLNDDPGHRFKRGAVDWSWQLGEPPLYPGQFHALSRYMFQPHPGHLVRDMAERYGEALRGAMASFVQDHLTRGTLPRSPSPYGGGDAPLAKVTIETLTTPGGDHELAARTMVGVLMGFIPTISGAVLNVLQEWQRDHRFEDLRTRLSTSPSYADALQALGDSLCDAAKMRPMPQVIWRTAREAHDLGEGDSVLHVAAGDRVVLGLVSGTQESLADGQPDGHLMFGGERVSPHPLHACPGHAAAMGSMLGMLAAILARDSSLRADAAPLTFMLEGSTNRPREAPPALLAASAILPGSSDCKALPMAHYIQLRTAFLGGVLGGGRGHAPIRLAAWGDSWLVSPYPFVGSNLVENLGSGFQLIDGMLSFRDIARWGMLEQMAAMPTPFCTFLGERLKQGTAPDVILLSGGGNDSTRNALSVLLRNKAKGKPLLEPEASDAHVARLRTYFVSILDALEATCRKAGKKPVSVLLHGYDHPIPKDMILGTSDWLVKPFFDAGYKVGDGTSADAQEAAGAMRELIDKLNVMQSGLTTTYAFVRKVELREIIAKQWTAQPTDGWLDNLHPKKAAFELMTDEIIRTIKDLFPARFASGGPAP